MLKTSLNMDENIESMLCYIGLWVTGIIFYFAEKENKTVKFHALQSILLFLPLTIVAPILGWIGAPKWSYGGSWYSYGHFDPGIPALLWLSWIIYLIIMVLAIVLIVTAYQGKKMKIPIIGNIADK